MWERREKGQYFPSPSFLPEENTCQGSGHFKSSSHFGLLPETGSLNFLN
jgi:hypothetical protein